MKLSPRHIFLLTGILSVFLSFLFFGIRRGWYEFTLTIGLLVATLSFLAIIIKKDTLKNKIFWTLVVVVSIILLPLSEPILIKTSYRIFLAVNKTQLTKIGNLVLTKSNGFAYSPAIYKDSAKELSKAELTEIQSLMDRTKILFVAKDSQKIFFRTWSMLDIQEGVYYFYGINKPASKFRQISGQWYR